MNGGLQTATQIWKTKVRPISPGVSFAAWLDNEKRRFGGCPEAARSGIGFELWLNQQYGVVPPGEAGDGAAVAGPVEKPLAGGAPAPANRGAALKKIIVAVAVVSLLAVAIVVAYRSLVKSKKN